MTRRHILGLFLCSIASIVFAQDKASVQDAIKRQNAALLEALKAGDAEAYAAIFDKDGLQMSPGGMPIIEGRDSILRQRRADFALIRVRDGEIETERLRLSGDLAYEIGRFRYELVGIEDGGVQEIKGRFLVIWRKQTDGRWLIEADVGLPD